MTCTRREFAISPDPARVSVAGCGGGGSGKVSGDAPDIPSSI